MPADRAVELSRSGRKSRLIGQSRAKSPPFDQLCYQSHNAHRVRRFWMGLGGRAHLLQFLSTADEIGS